MQGIPQAVNLHSPAAGSTVVVHTAVPCIMRYGMMVVAAVAPRVRVVVMVTGDNGKSHHGKQNRFKYAFHD